MALYLFVAVGLYLFFIAVKKKSPDEENAFFDRNFTTCLKGISIFMIILNHLFKYKALKGVAAVPLWIIGGLIDQIAVAPFFLFSGFGIMLGFMKRGRTYAKHILLRHILVLLLFNAVFLIPYYVRDYLLCGFDKPWYFYLEALVGLTDLDNVRWFIIAILSCYLSAVLAGLLPFKKDIDRVLTVTAGCLVYTVVMIVLGYDPFFYDTILAFPAGMLIALYQDKIKAFLQDKKRAKKIFIGCAVGYVPLTLLYLVIPEAYYACIRIPKLLLFIAIALCFDRYYTIRSKAWNFLGQHTYPIYMLHMLPILYLKDLEMSKSVYYLVTFSLIAVVSAAGMLVEVLIKKMIVGSKSKKENIPKAV